MKRAVALTLVFAFLVSTLLCGAVEVPSDTWYGGSVAYCLDKGVLRLGEAETLVPTAYFSKIEFIAMVVRGLSLFDDTDMAFFRAKDGYFKAAVDSKLLKAEDYPVETWAEPVSRFEVASICYQALTLFGGYVEDGSTIYLDGTPDLAEIPAKYRMAVNAVYASGVMGGARDDLTFQGWGGVTKALGCVILHCLLEESVRVPAPLPLTYGKLMGECTTNYNTVKNAQGIQLTYKDNRTFNILRAGNTLNEFVLEPGQTFSFNRLIGNAGRAEGYRKASIIANGKSAIGYGGGICQLATTIFNAALYANLQIVERHNHGLKSAYIPAGMDSTVSAGSIDLKLKNTYPCAVKFVFDHDADSDTITVRIFAQTDIVTPDVELKVTERRGLYTLTRYADGKANYTCTSRYKG